MKKTIVSALAALTGVAIGASAAGKVSSDKRKIVQQMSNKHLSLFLMMNQWVKVKHADVDIVSMDDNLETVDAVVVTAITFFDEIEEQLSAKMDCPILSLEDILYEI